MSNIQSLRIHNEANIYGASILGKDTVVDARAPTMSFLSYPVGASEIDSRPVLRSQRVSSVLYACSLQVICLLFVM